MTCFLALVISETYIAVNDFLISVFDSHVAGTLGYGFVAVCLTLLPLLWLGRSVQFREELASTFLATNLGCISHSSFIKDPRA